MKYETLSKMIKAVYDFYNQDLSPFGLSVWESALEGYELATISKAFKQHTLSSHFCPKPADIVEILSGNSSDHALLAWTKVINAVKHIGSGKSVVFDDSIIHLVIADMGGWIDLCSTKETELHFIEKRFIERYKLYDKMPIKPTHLVYFIGTVEANNSHSGYSHLKSTPIMIGDQNLCQKILTTPSTSNSLRVSNIYTPASPANDMRAQKVTTFALRINADEIY